MQETALSKLFYRYARAYEVLNHIVHFPDISQKRMLKPSISGGNGLLLELGCGTGLSSRVLKKIPANIINMDVNTAFVQYGSKKQRFGKPLVGSAYRLPFPDNLFRTIFVPDAFHHILDHDLLFSECFRTLKPRGMFVIFDIVHEKHAPNTIINHFADGIIWDLNQAGFKKKISALARQHGFQVKGFSAAKEKTLMGIVLNGVDIEASLEKK